MELDAVKELGDEAWSLYDKKFSIEPDGEYVIYARAVDNAGNAAYVSSDGIVVEKEPAETEQPPERKQVA